MKSLSKIYLFAYIAIIFISALVTLNNGTNKALNNIFILELRADYFVHACLFFVLMFLISKTYKVNLVRHTKLALIWILIALLIAFATEGVQLIITYRVFNINDLIANGLGVVLGIAFFALNKH